MGRVCFKLFLTNLKSNFTHQRLNSCWCMISHSEFCRPPTMWRTTATPLTFWGRPHSGQRAGRGKGRGGGGGVQGDGELWWGHPWISILFSIRLNISFINFQGNISVERIHSLKKNCRWALLRQVQGRLNCPLLRLSGKKLQSPCGTFYSRGRNLLSSDVLVYSW